MSLIQLKNVDFSYTKEDHAIRNLNLEIIEGTFVCILGQNGSGKSTLAKLMVGLLEKESGEIIIDNLQLNQENLYEIRKKIGIVFQNPDNQFVGVTVRHDIAFGLENLLVEREKMKKLVFEFSKKVGMDEYLDMEPRLLSGGQKQRVAIASMLAMNPKIMIFDEATSMLDPEGSKDVIELIMSLKEDSKTLIAVTHDLEFSLLADRIVVLNEGQVILDGTPLEVYKNVDILKKANLDLPLALSMYNETKNQKIKDTLWQYILKK